VWDIFYCVSEWQSEVRVLGALGAAVWHSVRRSGTAQFNWLSLWGLGAWAYTDCTSGRLCCASPLVLAPCYLQLAAFCLFRAGACYLLPFARILLVLLRAACYLLPFALFVLVLLCAACYLLPFVCFVPAVFAAVFVSCAGLFVCCFGFRS